MLASYWRERGLLPLEQAIHKMTGMSAQRFRIGERGQIAPGHWADVVVIDPARIRDAATFEAPTRPSEGVERVWVNGVLSYTESGGLTGQRAGSFVKRQTAPLGAPQP